NGLRVCPDVVGGAWAFQAADDRMDAHTAPPWALRAFASGVAASSRGMPNLEIIMRLALPSRHVRLAVALAVVAGLAACAMPQKSPKDDTTTCRAAAPGDALVGTWLSIRKERGIVGELQTLFVLNADGTMAYAERLKR